MNKLKILVLVRRFAEKYPKHRHKFDMITALEEFAEVEYWHKSSNIDDVLKKIRFKPDFILHYDVAWNGAFAPIIRGLDTVTIPKGCIIIDAHYYKNRRIRYIEKNKIDLIFSATKNPFLKNYPQYGDRFRWWPFSVNPEIIKDWNLKKDIDYLLMGQLYYRDKENPPKRLPPKGRYKFREEVLKKMKNKKGFLFYPHPGHAALPSENLMVNENYARQLNRSKIFFTCGSELGYPVAKFFEAPGCKTLLLAKPNQDILELGFKDGLNFVACDELNFYEKSRYYIKNRKEWEVITNNGYEFIHTYHTNRIRAQQLINCIKDYV